MFRKFLKLFGAYKDAEINHTLRESLEKNELFRKFVIKIHDSTSRLKPNNMRNSLKDKSKGNESIETENPAKESKNEESKNN